MLEKTSDKNKFGGYTFQIKIDQIWRIDIHQTNNLTHIIEIKEFGFFKDKIYASHATNSNLEETLLEALDKAYDFFLLQKNWTWTIEQRLRKEKDVMMYFETYYKK